MPVKDKSFWFVLFSAFVFGFIFFVENINHRFWLNDFKVYYLASKAFMNGDNVYGAVFGEDTGLFKYSPVLLLPFSILSQLPYYPASVIQYVVICISTIAAAFVIQGIVSKLPLFSTQKQFAAILCIGLMLVMNHLFRELHLGNLNMIIVFLLSSSLLLIIKNRPLLAACFLGTCILIKPYLVILLVVLFCYRQFKAVFGSGIFAVVCILGMALFTGFERTINLNKGWINAMTSHGIFLFSNHTVAGIINYYTHWNTDNISQYIFPLFALTAFVTWFVWTGKHKTQNLDHTGLVIHFFSLLALLPNLFITDTEHFLFSFPLILIALNLLFLNGNRLQVIVFSVLIILYGANSSDFFGNELSDQFEFMGLLGIGNLGLVFFTNYLLNQPVILEFNGAQKHSLT